VVIPFKVTNVKGSCVAIVVLERLQMIAVALYFNTTNQLKVIKEKKLIDAMKEILLEFCCNIEANDL
jgi:hypothetical protein